MRKAYDASKVSGVLIAMLGVHGVQNCPANETDQENGCSGDAANERVRSVL
jgi:hypothetical protein